MSYEGFRVDIELDLRQNRIYPAGTAGGVGEDRLAVVVHAGTEGHDVRA